MTSRGRPRVRLTTGGPAWEQRRAKQPQFPGFTKAQKEARRPLKRAMGELSRAIMREDWPAARAARAAAWDEVGKLHPDLTREDRKRLWEYKQSILASEARERILGKKPPRRPTRDGGSPQGKAG